MSGPAEPRPSPEKGEHATMEEAVRRAVRAAVLTHARLGNPVATSRDGKVVWLQPEEVLALLGEKPTGNGQQLSPGSGPITSKE